jgi:hypothetical protein
MQIVGQEFPSRAGKLVGHDLNSYAADRGSRIFYFYLPCC